MRTLSAVVLLTTAAGASMYAGEMATGSMLGPRYKPERFYVRRGGNWVETYSGGPYRGAAKGKLMMIRLAQGVFADERLSEAPFDPDENTDSVIAALDEYRRYGVLAIGVGLQGADPGYAEERNGIARSSAAADGPAGALISAFDRDGELKADWMKRLDRLLRAADKLGMFVCLTYFSPNQDEALSGPEAIVAAARNATRWLIENNHRNVLINVADGWDLERDAWDHVRFIPRNIAPLVLEIRDQFNGSAFSLPIGASTAATLSYPNSLARLCDVVMLRGAGFTAAEKGRQAKRLISYDRPVWMVGDAPAGEVDLSASARALFDNGSGWGFTPVTTAERFPFRYAPGPSLEDAALRAALAGIAELTLKKPPVDPAGDSSE